MKNRNNQLKKIYHEFIIVYRCRDPRYRMGLRCFRLLCRRINTCFISYSYYSNNFRLDQKTYRHIKIFSKKVRLLVCLAGLFYVKCFLKIQALFSDRLCLFLNLSRDLQFSQHVPSYYKLYNPTALNYYLPHANAVVPKPWHPVWV